MIYVYKDRIVNIEWTVLKGTSNVKENFDRALVKMFLIGPHEKYVLNANAVDGIVSAEVPQGLPEGVYSVEIIYIKNWLGVDRAPDRPRRFPVDCRGNDRCIMRTRKDNLFGITEYESEATNVGEGEVVVRVKTSTASYGYDGLSAYEIAVMRGDFEGTEGEWLEWTHERIVTDVRDLLDKMKSRDTRFVVRTKEQRDSLKDLSEGDEVYVIDDGMSYVLRMEDGQRVWHAQDYGSVTAKYMLSMIADLPNFVADRAVADEFGKRIVDEYLTRDAVRRYMNEVFKDLFIENPPTIMDGMITVDMLSDAVKQLIGFGPIVNFPDDEFLTTKNGRITLKDRNYDPNNYSGMGRKVLRKNMVNGVNVLTQRMMSCPNTVYVITYDFDLRGEEITVPEGCVLEFEGGSLRNGVIKFNNTKIESYNYQIFKDIDINGTLCSKLNVIWFGAKGNAITDDTLNIQKAASYKMPVYLPVGKYLITDTIQFFTDVYCDGEFLFTKTIFDKPIIELMPQSYPHIAVAKGIRINESNYKWGVSKYGGYGIVVHNLWTLYDCEVTSCKYGIVATSWVINITNCDARYNEVNLIVTAGSKKELEECNNVYVQGSTFDSPRTKFSAIIGDSPISGFSTWDIYGKNIRFVECAFDGGTVTIDKIVQVTFTSCYFENTKDSSAIILYDKNGYGSNYVFRNNHFNTHKYALTIDATRVSGVPTNYRTPDIVFEDNFMLHISHAFIYIPKPCAKVTAKRNINILEGKYGGETPYCKYYIGLPWDNPNSMWQWSNLYLDFLDFDDYDGRNKQKTIKVINDSEVYIVTPCFSRTTVKASTGTYNSSNGQIILYNKETIKGFYPGDYITWKKEPGLSGNITYAYIRSIDYDNGTMLVSVDNQDVQPNNIEFSTVVTDYRVMANKDLNMDGTLISKVTII